MTDGPASADVSAALALLEKLREFASGLEPRERRALAALLAPGVAAAWADEPEVAGFEWRADDVSGHLARAIRERDLRIVGW